MRKLPLTLLLVLLALFVSPLPAQVPATPDPAVAGLGEESEEDGDEDGDEVEEDGCTIEDEEDAQLCAEIAQEERESEQAEECILEDATAKLAALPSSRTVQLRIRYEAAAPTAIAIEARLRGTHGRLRLGAGHTHFRRAGVFRESFVLGEKQMERALTAREFEVELQALNTPRYCRLDLNGAPRRAKRPLRADAPGRSGDRGRTRGS